MSVSTQRLDDIAGYLDGDGDHGFAQDVREAAAEIGRLRVAAEHAEAVMTIVEPRGNKAEYLETLGELRAALGITTPIRQN